MSKVAIVYHSGFGHTDRLARDVAQGVADAGGLPDLLRIEPQQSDFGEFFDRIADADAIIFGSPTYMGTVSAPMKAFMDASARPYFVKAWKDKLGAAFTVSGSPSGDKLNTLTSLAIFAAQHGMLWIGTGQAPGNNDDHSAATDAENRLGSFIGAMAQAAIHIDHRSRQIAGRRRGQHGDARRFLLFVRAGLDDGVHGRPGAGLLGFSRHADRPLIRIESEQCFGLICHRSM